MLTQSLERYSLKTPIGFHSANIQFRPAQCRLKRFVKRLAHYVHLNSREKLFGINVLDEMNQRQLFGIDRVIMYIACVAIDRF